MIEGLAVSCSGGIADGANEAVGLAVGCSDRISFKY